MTEQDFDVVVMGGGPAGATVASLLARDGFATLVVERAEQPSFKVGESLMPATYSTLRRLELLDDMRASAFPVKASVQFYSPDGRATTPFYFEEHDPRESSRTWQVLRSDFDAMLLNRAAEDGATVRRGVIVKQVLFDDDRAMGVQLVAEDGSLEEQRCRVVVDATGQRALLARQRQLLESDPCLLHASYFTHFEGAVRDVGRDAGATLILHTESRKSWFWFIPLPGERVSVGVVGGVDYLVRDRSGQPQAVFEEELTRCPAVAARLETARQILPIQVIRDYSYRVGALAGNGWVSVGDAAGFIDPIYSTGVFLALKSGEMAADAISSALAANDPTAARLGSFEPELRRGMEALSQLVYAFYTPHFSFADFLRRHPDCRGELIDLLMGQVFEKPVDRLLAALKKEMQSAPTATGSSHEP